jgi:pteridine reductase
MTDRLTGHVALVTGAARRIGAAIVRELHATGASVAIHHRGAEDEAARLEADLNRTRPGSAFRVRADLLDATAPEALVASVLERWGSLDLLVNNASAFYPVPVGAIEERHWSELIGSNLKAPLFLSQAAAPALAKRGGAIVNIVDIHADRPLAGYAVYSIAKAGLAAMTRALAIELAPKVRVNGVSPGAIAWPDDGQFPSPERERIIGTTPLARVGKPEEIASAVAYLAGAPFVTGQILAVDGGRSVFL